ncbi:lasso RiPP family leader peptide-containing protein [Streptomyces sp. NPDC097640]
MRIDEVDYEKPQLVEVGDFAKLTMGNGPTGGIDWRWECWFFLC